MTAAGDTNPLGRYLRARRALVQPDEAWDQGHRRVPGLRREEVAFLAGISSDYYNRLEQGRDRNPSEQVLRSIARALRLDEEATTYLLEIATRKSPRRKRPEGRSRSVTACARSSTPGHSPGVHPRHIHGRPGR
ncbi:helix-turn-helix domain-containing protein [Streptomyces mirabilis]|uniref:helix-turn-helix domain-containing protein n=1 Tax=Streptomyces mirabilis TaxID=68239 RepID=UPI003637D17E